MSHLPRNFSAVPRLHTAMTAPGFALSSTAFFALRSLLPSVVDAIPRRNSSSSLPPSFVSGRFAGFCFPAPRALTGAGA